MRLETVGTGDQRPGVVQRNIRCIPSTTRISARATPAQRQMLTVAQRLSPDALAMSVPIVALRPPSVGRR